MNSSSINNNITSVNDEPYQQENSTTMNSSSIINNNITSVDDEAFQQDLVSWTVFIFILMFLWVLLLLFLIDRFFLKHYREERQQQLREIVAARSARMMEEENENKSAVTNPMTKLCNQERKVVYKQVFNSTGNRIVLTKDHLRSSNLDSDDTSTSSATKEDMPSNCNSGDDSSHRESKTFVDIELGGNNETDDDTTSMTTGILSSTSIYAELTQPQPLDNILATNDGTCIICFEDFAVDDVIVWSGENNDCPHVYHEECMIDYLTAKRRPKKTNSNTNEDETETEHSDNTDDTSIGGGSVNSSSSSSSSSSNDEEKQHATTASTIIIEQNPCPTCRRNFCSITLDDFNNYNAISTITTNTRNTPFPEDEPC
jgi:hypothetical protein